MFDELGQATPCPAFRNRGFSQKYFIVIAGVIPGCRIHFASNAVDALTSLNLDICGCSSKFKTLVWRTAVSNPLDHARVMFMPLYNIGPTCLHRPDIERHRAFVNMALYKCCILLLLFYYCRQAHYIVSYRCCCRLLFMISSFVSV